LRGGGRGGVEIGIAEAAEFRWWQYGRQNQYFKKN